MKPKNPRIKGPQKVLLDFSRKTKKERGLVLRLQERLNCSTAAGVFWALLERFERDQETIDITEESLRQSNIEVRELRRKIQSFTAAHDELYDVRYTNGENDED